jgi:hypothetical protein
MDVAEDLVVPIMDFPIRIDRDALTLGYAGVYGSFLLFAKRAGVKYGVPARDILVELGRRGMVGGQEDMIEDTAMTMARERGLRRGPRRTPGAGLVLSDPAAPQGWGPHRVGKGLPAEPARPGHDPLPGRILRDELECRLLQNRGAHRV